MSVLKKTLTVFAVGFAAAMTLYAAVVYFTNLLSPWSSEAKVRQRILALTPFGSSVDKVKTILKSEHWPLWYDAAIEGKVDADVYPGVKGVYAVGADLGEHFGFPFRYGADAYWGFDADGKMIDLKVRVTPKGL